MAQKATIYKAKLEVADLNRNHFGTYQLALALHPSETTERLMVRLLVFALHAGNDLKFGRGISTDNEPDLWVVNNFNEAQVWIELGQPDIDRIRKASKKSAQVCIYGFRLNAFDPWWRKLAPQLESFHNVSIYRLQCDGIEALNERNMQLQCTIQDDTVYLSNSTTNFECKVSKLTANE